MIERVINVDMYGTQKKRSPNKKMDIKNYFLKRKQKKALNNEYGAEYFTILLYHCPKCIWGTDVLTCYVTHLENHLIKRKGG